ncbi:hypothetical protein OB13_08720 [Pontibacter sp. HJ8]
MKLLVLLLCVMCVLVQPLSKQAIYLVYELNKEYIATELCEQRLIPDSDCDGKCYLRKALKKDSEREKESQRQQQTVLDMILYKAESVLKIPAIPILDKTGSTLYKAGVCSTPDFSVFHPPRFIS